MTIGFLSLMNGVSWGGSEVLWFNTARQAIGDGHKVITITREHEHVPPKLAELKRLGAQVNFYKPNKSIYARISKLLGRKSKSAWVVPAVHADIFLVSNGSTFDFITYNPVFNGVIGKRPFFMLSQHNYEVPQGFSDVSRMLAREVFSESKGNFFVSKRNWENAARELASSIDHFSLINNPINPAVRPNQGLGTSDVLRMACVARLECKFKGQDILLQCLSSENWRSRKYLLRFYGEGPDLKYLQELTVYYGLESHIRFEGQVADINKIWSENDLLVLPSLSEGTPLAMLEAMYAGRPVLGTDVGDISSYVIEGETGYLAGYGSVSLLRESFEQLWSNKHNLQQLGSNAYAKVKSMMNAAPEKELLHAITSSL